MENLPSEIIARILEYHHPYKKWFSDFIVQNQEIWRAAWFRWYRLQTDHKIILTMYYIFICWGLFEEDPQVQFLNMGVYQEKWKYFPTDIHITLDTDEYATSIFISNSQPNQPNIMFIGMIMNREQVQYYWNHILQTSNISNFIPVYDDQESGLTLFKYARTMGGWGRRQLVGIGT